MLVCNMTRHFYQVPDCLVFSIRTYIYIFPDICVCVRACVCVCVCEFVSVSLSVSVILRYLQYGTQW